MTLASRLAVAGRVQYGTRMSIEPVRPPVPGLRCHAGAGHDPAAPRGAFGDLCERCYAAVLRLVLS